MPPESRNRIGAMGPRGRTTAPMDRVVALFSGAGTVPPAEDDDWSASLLAVRDAAARVREMQTSARDAVCASERAVRAAEDRTRQAEAAMREAVARAERAEEQARLAAERADRAEARTAEARTWLRRMHECMVNEFGALTLEAPQP
ncbi:hypothetical protein [Methylobacterium sp. NEAU K]|uniref:hypothetical protein n=1 Tax=Methylobacterium sp. NEAU K TaxID=3064946 RepID=UPI0027365C69|nr:hypothetical protein [Methylobacterium sp. NEAU K]MDP4005189.1 hypothetical protein [Methylobacterium sp. NEAU K]